MGQQDGQRVPGRPHAALRAAQPAARADALAVRRCQRRGHLVRAGGAVHGRPPARDGRRVPAPGGAVAGAGAGSLLVAVAALARAMRLLAGAGAGDAAAVTAFALTLVPIGVLYAAAQFSSALFGRPAAGPVLTGTDTIWFVQVTAV